MPASSLARRIIYFVASFAPAWALVATFTGGVGWVIGPLRISSRQPFRPLLLGVMAAIYYVWRYTREERAADGQWLESRLKPVIPWAIPVAVILGFFLGVHYGSFAAAGSDSYGYVSQARLWLDGTLRVRAAVGGAVLVAKSRVGVYSAWISAVCGERNDCPNLSRLACPWSWQPFSRLWVRTVRSLWCRLSRH